MSSTSRSRSSTPSRDSPQSDEAIESTTPRRISSNHPLPFTTPSVSSPIAMRKSSTGCSPMHYANNHHNIIRSRITSAVSSPSSPGKSRANSNAAHQTTPPSSPASPSTTGGAPVPGPPFNFKLFKKCKSATFQIDGATYTIGMSLFSICDCFVVWRMKHNCILCGCESFVFLCLLCYSYIYILTSVQLLV